MITKDAQLEYLLGVSNFIMATTSRNEKIARLKIYDSLDTKEFLKFLLDSNVVTGISSSKIKKKIRYCCVDNSIMRDDNFRSSMKESRCIYFDRNAIENLYFLDFLKYFDTHNTGSDADIAFVQAYIDANPERYSEFIKKVVTKTLRLGVDAKTVNKAYDEIVVPIFDVQLAKSMDNVKIPDDKWFSISQKINGNRCVIYRGKAYSRQGKEWIGLNHILDEANKMCDLDEMCLDGELVYANEERLSDALAFTKGTGILNSPNADKSSIRFVVFDALRNDEFDNGISRTKYKFRRDWLLTIKDCVKNLKYVSIVPMFYDGTDKSQIDLWLDYANKHDMEGIMVNYDTPYMCKRHAGIVKVKSFHTADLRIVDFEEGTGKNSGTLGSIVVEYKNNRVKVGSGFEDAMRNEIWNNKDKYLNRIAEIKYKVVSKNKDTGLESLQFPVFVRFRDDKSEESYD